MGLLVEARFGKMLLEGSFMIEAGLGKFRPYIEKKLKTDEVDDEIRSAFKYNRSAWIKNSMAEWKMVDGDGKLTIEKDFHGKTQLCQLCNHKLPKWGFHVQNVKNDKELYIGEQCLGHIVNREYGTGKTRTPEEYRRIEMFIDQCKNLYEFLSVNLSNDAEFEVSSDTYNYESNLRKHVRTLFNSFVDGNWKYNELGQAKNSLTALKRRIANDMADKTLLNGLSKILREQLELDQIKEYAKIRQIVRDNNGYLNTEAVALIRDIDVLRDYQKQFTEKNNSDKTNILSLSLNSKKRFTVTYINHIGEKISFSYLSKVVIGELKYPIDELDEVKTNRLLINDKQLDNNSTNQALRTGIHYVTQTFGMDQYEVPFNDFKVYTNHRERDTKKEDKTKLNKSKFNNIKKASIIFKDGEQYMIVKKGKMISLGVNAFISELADTKVDGGNMVKKDKDALLKTLYIDYISRYSN